MQGWVMAMTIKQSVTFIGVFVVALALSHYVSYIYQLSPWLDFVLSTIAALGAATYFLIKFGRKKGKILHFLNNIDIALIVTDNQGNITLINSKAKEMFGLGQREKINIKEMPLDKDSPLHYLVRTLNGSQVYQEPYFTSQSGENIQYFYINATNVLNDQGQPVGALLVAWPVSEQSFHGLQLSQSGKLTMIGELAAGTAHEIRNPLTSVRGLIQIIDQRLLPQDPTKEYLSVIMREIDQINHIIKELLLLARRTTPNLSFTSLPAILDHVLSLIEGEAISKGIIINKKYQDNLPLMVLDEDQIKQVFWHLASNAINAMSMGGQLTVAVTYYEQQEQVEINFIDTGTGISKENISRIFLPFFTTRAEGTGLGLPVSYQIVDNHGGKLSVKSAIGKGSTFTVKLPLVNYQNSKAS